MLFMNEYDIQTLRVRYALHPVLGPATRFLDEFKDEVNAHSDGWPYWSAPVKAAKQLIALIQSHTVVYRPVADRPITADDVRKAIAPIKAFMTRRGKAAGMTLPELEEMP